MGPIEHLKSHVTKEYLERLSNMALASAGFSAGLLVSLVQAKGEAFYSEIALWFTIVSLVLSLSGWQYFLPYILHGASTYNHVSFGLVAFLQISIVMSLFISVTALVWQLSCYAGVTLVLLGVGLVVFVFRHNSKVAEYCENSKA